MPAATAREMPMPQKDRPRGSPTEVKTYRIPTELTKWLDSLGGYSQAKTLVEQLDFAQSAREALGDDLWVEIRARAAREEDLYEGQALGKVLGQLAREALEKKGGKR
jgi:hypothetical protein